MKLSTLPVLLVVGAVLCGGCDGGSDSPRDAAQRHPETAADPKGPEHPNVLLMVIDTLRADRLGCYGYHRATSPNIDRLAGRSVVFDQAFANSDGTILSHISLLTSRYTAPRESGPGPTPTLAEVFSQAGYGTYGVAANPALVPVLGWGRGFDRYTDRPLDDETLDRLKDDKNYSLQIEARSAAQTTDFVLDAMRRHQEKAADKPWFLFVNYLDPHDPYTERKPWSDEFHESPSDISGTLRPQEGITIWSWVAETLPTLGEDDVRRLGELYDAEVRYADGQIQRVFDYLRQTDQSDNTIVLITSDHGEALGEHDMFTHMLAALDVELRVPLILSVPWLSGQQIRCGELVESVDVGPTVLALCGIGVPVAFQGRALLDPAGRLLPTGRSYTRHTHHAVNGKERRELNYPPEAALDSIVLRFADSKVYFLADGRQMLFDISDYPNRKIVSDFAETVTLLNRALGRAGPAPETLPEEAREALRSLGYMK